jgi:hypothetical protein
MKSLSFTALMAATLSLVLSGCLSTSIGIGPVRIPVYTPEPEKKKPPKTTPEEPPPMPLPDENEEGKTEVEPSPH